jgi:hypothetical protein
MSSSFCKDGFGTTGWAMQKDTSCRPDPKPCKSIAMLDRPFHSLLQSFLSTWTKESEAGGHHPLVKLSLGKDDAPTSDTKPETTVVSELLSFPRRTCLMPGPPTQIHCRGNYRTVQRYQTTCLYSFAGDSRIAWNCTFTSSGPPMSCQDTSGTSAAEPRTMLAPTLL